MQFDAKFNKKSSLYAKKVAEEKIRVSIFSMQTDA